MAHLLACSVKMASLDKQLHLVLYVCVCVLACVCVCFCVAEC